jgi:hypothetical protein
MISLRVRPLILSPTLQLPTAILTIAFSSLNNTLFALIESAVSTLSARANVALSAS